MKTMLTDKSLLNLELLPDVDSFLVYAYTKTVREAGAKFIEIRSETLKYLPNPTEEDNYIFRLERPEQIVTANAYPFAYIAVPLQMSNHITELNRPAILELKVRDGIDIITLIGICRKHISPQNIAMIRLVGDFTMNPEEFANFVWRYRRHFPVPLDICPINATLGALSAAITAYAAHVDCITMEYGSDARFAALEEFLITLGTMYKVDYCPNYITGICKTVVSYNLITGKNSGSVDILARACSKSTYSVGFNVDAVKKSNFVRRPYSLPQPGFETALEKKVYNLGLDAEVCDDIMDVIDENSGVLNSYKILDKHGEYLN